MEKSAFEALGGSYMEVNGTLIPDLVILLHRDRADRGRRRKEEILTT